MRQILGGKNRIPPIFCSAGRRRLVGLSGVNAAPILVCCLKNFIKRQVFAPVECLWKSSGSKGEIKGK